MTNEEEEEELLLRRNRCLKSVLFRVRSLNNKASWETSRNNISNKASCFPENKFIFIKESFPKNPSC